MRLIFSTLIVGVLAGCTPAVPDSGAVIGFDNSLQAKRAREAALNTGQPIVPSAVLSSETTGLGGGSAQPVGQPLSRISVPAPQPAAPPQDDIAAETAAALRATNTNSGQAPLQANPANPIPAANNTAISDENDFSAVSGRQTIASDAERIAQNRAQYQVITPKSVPKRVGGSQPNIVEFALKTSNQRGTKVYSRLGINSASRAARNCAKFVSPDQAQSAFLAQGGPQKDRKGLDPDGDGFACSWDPAPFRQAARN